MNREEKPIRRFSLEEVQQRFEDWRKRRKPRTTIPETLWQAAVSLSGQYSTHKISRALRLNHTALRDRIQAYTAEKADTSLANPAFIKLDINSPFLTSIYTMEIERPDGCKMRIHSDANSLDIIALSKAFWGNGI